MAAGPTVEVVGARELRASLKKAGSDLEDLKGAHAEVGRVVVAASQARAPKDSGTLSGSIRANKAKTSVVVRAGGAKAPYANPIHWGWPVRNIAANPFISTAAQATEDVWVGIYFRSIEGIVDNIKGA